MTSVCAAICVRNENHSSDRIRLWLREDDVRGGETEQKYATTLVAVDADLFFVNAFPVVRKEATDYSATGLNKFIEVLSPACAAEM